MSATPTDRLAQWTRACLTILVVSALCALGLRYVPVLKVAENWAHDIRIATLTPPMPQSDHIAIVAVTEETLAAFPYRSPLDRGFLADLLNVLERKGVRLIGLDILFDQPTEPEKDDSLRRTLENLDVPVVVASADTSDGLTEAQASYLAEYVDDLPHGDVGIAPDAVDGVVRAIHLRKQEPGGLQAGFAAVAARLVGATVPDTSILHLDYRGRPNPSTSTFPSYPAHAVHLLPDAWLQDRIVLIGGTLPLEDRHRTPFSLRPGEQQDTMPGIVIYAHALSQLLEGRVARHPTAWQKLLVIVLFAAAGLVLGMLNLPLTIKSGIGMLACVLAWGGGFFFYRMGGPLLPLVTPTLALLGSGGLVLQMQWQREQTRRQFIHKAFSRFVAPTVVDQLVAEPERLKLTGEHRELSFLFTDVAAFTTLTEQADAETLIRVLNWYLDGACQIVLRHGGTIDKIVGDALHVFFNAPLDQPGHPERAVACALELDRFCQEFARRQSNNGLDFGVTRIGINTGITIVGNVGGEARFDYSAYGDAINTAARLESLNRHLGTRVCVAGVTARRCPCFSFRPIGRIRLKGKALSIDVFEPLQADEADETWMAEYLSGYALLEQGDPQAAGVFERLAKKYPDDKLIEFHARRLSMGEMDVVITMTEK